MAFQHKALTELELGPGAAKVTSPDAPAPMKVMAARGLAPLGPRDLVVVLYQFWVTNEPKLAEDAAKTVTGLPTAILAGALGDPSLPSGVLDFLGRKLASNEEILEQVVRHPNVHDESLAGIARVCPDGICDILSENQQRWLAFPTIVESLYHNPNCRMSVVHRMLELAVRQGIELKLPNMDEIKAALGDAVPDESRDEVFRSAAGKDIAENHAKLVDQVRRAGAGDEVDYDAMREDDGEDIDIDALLDSVPDDSMSLPLEGEGDADDKGGAPKPHRLGQITRLLPMEKIRLATIGGIFERGILIRDSNKAVAISVIKSPRIRENEVIAYSKTPTLSIEVIREIAKRRDWTKLYQVQLNLVLNPKTPLSSAMGFLGRLRSHDVKKVALSRNIPSALAQAAKRKVDQSR
jgi:hypothetical protein